MIKLSAERDDVHEATLFLPFCAPAREAGRAAEEAGEPLVGKVVHVLFSSTVLDREETAWAELALLVAPGAGGRP